MRRSVRLPFDTEAFFQVFVDYNTAIGPAPIVAWLLGIVAVVLVLWPMPWSGRAISAILAAFWLWTGIGYHILFFAPINPAAYGFGALFVVQGLLFLWCGVHRKRLDFSASGGVSTIVGGVAIVYAMLVYPIIGYLLGHGYPRAPLFGVAPCPTTIFTIGLLCLADRPMPWALWLVPLLWSLIGGTAAWLLGVPEDLGLWIAGLAAVVLILKPHK
jgi:hypothetical protein